ncbi:hypothetical protein GGI25_001721 [Coemansia spiralis]|uniref:Uncharacterized protein n=2 Tax=Coemansia TaxID=4863 RepID=A0A9W8G9S5_9FUNG|nr:hypothetical protein EDC05_003473 [Coemansia umbellata]KAJ2624939.1 hypothetical protein GGI26_001051 [Coemansia sp. RSA 1358]KAJ2679153.1 hypothetical protein GGI25_001721 [Coemansia spiralis]
MENVEFLQDDVSRQETISEGEAKAYSDNLLEITGRSLTIHRYFFPSLASKSIKWEDVEWVKTGEEAKLGWLHMRLWGLAWYSSRLFIWWNLKPRVLSKGRQGMGVHGMEDIRPTSLVIKTRGSNVLAGTFVKYPEIALPVIRELVARNHLHNE